MALKLTNNATSTLAGNVLIGATSLTVQAADASKFPTLAAGDWFPATLTDAAGNLELLKVTARAGAAFTIERAQEDTTARAWTAGDRIDLRPTAAALAALADEVAFAGRVHGATAAAIDDADEFGFWQAASGLWKKLTFSAMKATAAQFMANANALLLSVAAIWTAAAEVTVAYAATTTLDFSTFLNAKITLTGNVTFAAPSNQKPGQSGCIRIIQDATGSRTAAFNTAFKWVGGSAGVLSTAANAQDLLYYHIVDTGIIHLSLNKAIS